MGSDQRSATALPLDSGSRPGRRAGTRSPRAGLCLAAVLGTELDLRRIATVTGLDAAGVADALRTAGDAGLVVHDLTGDVRWRHALTCSAVLAGLTPT